MSDMILIHHGIKGQKWGVRNYQNPDGSLTAAGKSRYKSQMENYKSEKVYLDKKQNIASREYDKKISDQYKNESNVKSIVKDYLLGPSGHLTYNMAKAQNHSRARAFIETALDINGGRAVEGIAAALGSTVGNKLGGLTGSTAVASAAGNATGLTARQLSGSKMASSGSEYSLRQRSLRNKYVNSHS